ncbi:MAG: preprotein translocase subunit SecE [Eubacteriales bacterium]|nr:preprotein translocase subunit SecE [Eubacteriales bacterium]
MSKISNIFKNMKIEFNKIIFPNTEKIWKDSVCVLTGSIIIGVIIAVLDIIISTGFSFILK